MEICCSRAPGSSSAEANAAARTEAAHGTCRRVEAGLNQQRTSASRLFSPRTVRVGTSAEHDSTPTLEFATVACAGRDRNSTPRGGPGRAANVIVDHVDVRRTLVDLAEVRERVAWLGPTPGRGGSGRCAPSVLLLCSFVARSSHICICACTRLDLGSALDTSACLLLLTLHFWTRIYLRLSRSLQRPHSHRLTRWLAADHSCSN